MPFLGVPKMEDCFDDVVVDPSDTFGKLYNTTFYKYWLRHYDYSYDKESRLVDVYTRDNYFDDDNINSFHLAANETQANQNNINLKPSEFTDQQNFWFGSYNSVVKYFHKFNGFKEVFNTQK